MKRLPASVIDDRIRRYLADEPLKRIAHDHGVSIAAVCHTVRRHAPNLPQRPRGGGAK